MDPRERNATPVEVLRTALDGRQAAIWTALPCIVNTFDPVAMTLTAQPTSLIPYRNPSGKLELLQMPLLLDCPVMFPGGGGVTLTFPVKQGDECLMVFASRCIDSWWQSGGVQAPSEFRMHDLSDGFAFVGVRSQPRRLTVSTGAAQLRSDSGLTIVEVDGDGEIINLTSPNPITITAPGLHVTGAIIAGFGGMDAVNVQTHVHGGVQTGGSETDAPVPGS